MALYFAQDGNYGDAENLVIIDDTSWTEKDFAILEEFSDEGRAELAQAIQKWIADGRPEIMDDMSDTFGIALNLPEWYRS